MKRMTAFSLTVLLALLIFLPAIAVAVPPPVVWNRIYDSGTDDWAACCGVTLDAAGNVLVTGSSYNGLNSDIRTIKYDPNGNMLWNQIFDSGRDDWGNCCGSVMVDSLGNVIVTGVSYDPLAGYINYLVVKYDAAGGFLWSQSYYAGQGGGAGGAVIDAGDNIIIFGASYNGLNTDLCTVKYDSNGVFQWDRIYDSGNNDYFGSQIGVDSLNNVVVVGAFYNGLNNDIRSIKYDPNGVMLWTRVYDSGNDDWGSTAAIDSGDNVIVAGSFHNGLNSDVRALKYDSAGNLLWDRTYDTGGNEDAYAALVDSADNVVVAGSSYNGLNNDILNLKYDSAGTLLWSQTYDSGVEDWFSSIVLDSSDNIIIAGTSMDTISWMGDYHTIKYDPNGNELWVATYDRGGDDMAAGVAVDAGGNVIVFGSSSNGMDMDFCTIKYGDVAPPVCYPSIDIILNQTSFTTGETLTVQARVTNDATPDDVDVKIWAELPDGSLMSIYNNPSYHIPAGTDTTMPLFSHTFSSGEPAGAYQFGGRLLNWINGDVLCEDIEPFSFTP